MENQATVNSEISFSGTGLHTGRVCRVTLLPAPADTGLVFRNMDLAAQPEFLASPDNIYATSLCSVIGSSEDNKIMTVEHLLAALFGLGIDNLFIEVENSEIPILDGSALPFVERIIACGIKRLHSLKKHYLVKRKATYQQGKSLIELTPSDSLSFHCRISFDTPIIGDQKVDFYFGQDDFMTVCKSRTFCRLADVATMRENGLALGGSLQNAIVVTEDRVLNPEGLRIAEEFAYHKLLDFFGDLSLLTFQVMGKFSLCQPGHDVNTKFVAELFNKADWYLYDPRQSKLDYYPTAVMQG